MHLYDSSHRALQDRFDTRRLADRLEQVKVHDRLTAEDRAFIESRDMFFLATVGADGQPNCSYKGGDPGFVRVVSEDLLAFPSWDGNGMFLSLGNVSATAKVGMLFVDFEKQRRLRVNGSATLVDDAATLATWPGAQIAVHVRVSQVFPNCPRYIHRYVRAERSPYIPAEGVTPPVPAWKRADWACDVLPANDPARSED